MSGRNSCRRGAVALIICLALGLGGIATAAPLRVGAKVDIETPILAELVATLLRSADIPAQFHRELSGSSQVIWRAIKHGDVDLYPDYTATLTNELLHDPSLKTIVALRQRLAAEGLGVTESLGFDDSYGIGMTEQRARELGIAQISDLKQHPMLRFGLTHEFIDRAEGFRSLSQRYGLPQTAPRGFDHELAYRALAAGNVDVVDVYTLDSEIDSYHLRVLKDDLGHFPLYEAVIVYRLSLPAPALAMLRHLEGRISRETMMQLNRRAKLDKVPETQLAVDFLREQMGITAVSGVAHGRVREIVRRTGEHLTLVGISLLLAMLLALPLGVLTIRRPLFGELVLGGLGIIQTIPSLALLVFLLPLLGVGSAPAVIALFLYSLLPIVRGTATGLKEIAPALSESAEALGLSRWAQLRCIELPLASRSILAGIKTAAVINVGTATIGALIGAGGYGQPILIGIRKDDLGTILEGAIPAAVLALLVQALFELLEYLVVPKGLRLNRSAGQGA